MKIWQVVLLAILGLAVIMGLSYAFGWNGVVYTKTVGKAQQNANREVYEQTQSYVEGKRQELIKLHHEWKNADKQSKEAIEATIRLSFANFDETKLVDTPELYGFLRQIKYN